MQHQFKSGDLALIVGSTSGISPNIGKCITLISRIATGGDHLSPSGKRVVNRGPDCWIVEAPGLVAGLKAGGYMDVGGIALVLDKHLMPLRDDHAPQSENQKELTHG